MAQSTSAALVSSLPRSTSHAAATPTKTQLSTATTAAPSPGNFRHPRLTEILSRQAATSLSSRNVQHAVVNFGCLAATFILAEPVNHVLAALLSTITTTTTTTKSSPAAATTSGLVLLVLRIYLLVNIVLALRPVIPYISQPDEITDIPLTPTQRVLLGLDPSVASTPGQSPGSSAGFVTPPRYHRTSGASSASVQSASYSGGRRSVSANYGSSPLSASRYTAGFSPSPLHTQSNSPHSHRLASGSAYSPTPAASPLLHRAVTQNNSHRSEFETSQSSLGLSQVTFSSSLGMGRSHSVKEMRHMEPDVGPSTPSPSARRTPVVAAGLNYKWLYDKGMGLPRSESTGF